MKSVCELLKGTEFNVKNVHPAHRAWVGSSSYKSFVLFSFRRSCSLDVEVSASGFTKDLQANAELLHPAGPGDEELEEEDDDDDEEEEEASDEEGEKGEEGFDVDEYKHAMLELEGLKVSETSAGRSDQEEESSEESEEVPEVISTAGAQEETRTELEEELKEAEDECPELAELSASNKEFKPFR